MNGSPNAEHFPPSCAQLKHCFPPQPHTVSEKTCTQFPKASQHPPHVIGPHCDPASGGVTHCWFEQVWLLARQVWQLVPELPHAVLVMPCWHWPNESQQPDGQDCALQTPASRLAPHCWLEHWVPESVQFSQEIYGVPHSVSEAPGWQAPVASQQPVVQLHGGGGMQT